MDIEHGWHTNSNTPTLDYLIPTTAEFDISHGWEVGKVEYPKGVLLAFAFVDEPISVYEGRVSIIANIVVPENAIQGPVPVAVEVRYQACNDTTCLPPGTSRMEAILTVGAQGPPANEDAFGISLVASRRPSGGSPETVPSTALGEDAAEADSTAAGAPGRGLAGVLVLALLGGLILNVMPCVLPVLSLKVFSLVKSAGEGRGEAVRGGVMTSLGILASFWALAGAAIVARTAGKAVGWGVQFQEPGFVTFLAVIVLLFSLNLWGLFEIPMPARLANRLASGGGGSQGAAGHFASGLFATLMATPCSAPFLGTAISFALSQPPVGILAVFTAVGLGMSLPYLLLAAWPGAARLFPKPGAWMETVRGVMGFLLAAAAIWLFFVLASQIDPARLAFIQLALLLLSLGVWLASRGGGVAKSFKTMAGVGALAAALWAVGLAATAAPTTGSGVTANHLIQWVPFDRGQAESLAREGTPVFVDVTANWCVTCKVVERGVLETEVIAEAFDKHGVVAMKADWTNYDEDIGSFLQEHGRAGIPFYLLYRPGDEPFLFSELPTRKSILSALENLERG